jgi:glucans biosynthesis protein
MKWGLPEIGGRPSGRIVATRTAAGQEHGVKLYLIDFEGEKLRSLPENAAVEVDIGVGGGEVIEQHIQKNSVTQGWRLAFQVKKKTGPLDRVTAGNDQPLELRAFLRLGDEILTETWSYVDPF